MFYRLFRKFSINNPQVKPEKIMKLLAFAVLGKEQGFRRLRDALGYRGSPNQNRKWGKLKKEFESLTYCKAGGYQAVYGVSKEMERFERVEELFD